MTQESIISETSNIELLAKQVVEGFIIGLHKSPFHGFSVEFAEHRLYNTGEPIKNIDWKVFGRTDKLFSKKYEEETNLRCQLIVDCSGSMYFPQTNGKPDNNSKIKFAVVAAACFQQLMKKQRDAVGLSLFSNDVLFHADAKSSSIQHQLINVELQKLIDSPTENKTSNTALALHQIAEGIHKRSLIIILSDMMDNMSSKGLEDIFAALQHLKYNKHEVIVFDIADKKQELDFNFENRPYEFIDLETGEKIKLQSEEIKLHYISQMQKIKQDLKLKCAQYKIDLIEADVNEGVQKILMPYLLKRQKLI
ncbi:MAG: hypothetical protein RJA07_1207 [Bacteroidota bacterium]|jgi:uncharacterized protein (DUF58 family)